MDSVIISFLFTDRASSLFFKACGWNPFTSAVPSPRPFSHIGLAPLLASVGGSPLLSVAPLVPVPWSGAPRVMKQGMTQLSTQPSWFPPPGGGLWVHWCQLDPAPG